VDVKRNTLNKAILDKRLHKPAKKKAAPLTLIASNKCERNSIDHQAPIGIGATNTLDRMAAMLGQISGVPIYVLSGWPWI